MKPQSPCLKCEKRVIGCHDTCTEYQEYKDKLNEWNEKVRKGKGAFFRGKRYFKSNTMR